MTVLAHFGSTITYIVPFLFVLTLVVFIHEMGHFLVGRWCGIKVDAFSLGFGPELLHFTDRKGTRWRLAALPLGGYVKFHGDANGASMADEDQIDAMPPEEKALTFFGQPVWKRAAVVVAGPLANFILALVVFTTLYSVHGVDVLNPVLNAKVGTILPGSAADAAGFRTNDVIVAINGKTIANFNDIVQNVKTSTEPLEIVVDRQGTQIALKATPRQGKLGIGAAVNDPSNVHQDRYGPAEAFQMAASSTWSIVSMTGQYIGGVVMGRESADQISGPIRIAEVSNEMAQLGITYLFKLVAILSVSIGLLNLLPIPLLDGGHLLYYAFEAVRGRALGEKTQQFGFRLGITFVAALTIFAAYNDISRLVRQAIH